MLTSALYIYLSGFSLFLLGFSVFMYFENRKFDDNQFTVKLLPPPRPVSPELEVSGMEAITSGAEKAQDVTSMAHLIQVQVPALA